MSVLISYPGSTVDTLSVEHSITFQTLLAGSPSTVRWPEQVVFGCEAPRRLHSRLSRATEIGQVFKQRTIDRDRQCCGSAGDLLTPPQLGVPWVSPPRRAPFPVHVQHWTTSVAHTASIYPRNPRLSSPSREAQTSRVLESVCGAWCDTWVSDLCARGTLKASVEAIRH